MKKSTINRLLGTPGAKVSLSPEHGLRIDGRPVPVPWGFAATTETGVLLAMPRPGLLKLDEDRPASLGRFVAPSLLDTFATAETLRKHLGLKPTASGAYAEAVEPGSDGLARQLVAVLRALPMAADWKRQLTLGIAAGMGDALANGIKLTDGAGAWAAALVDAVEVTVDAVEAA